MISCQSRDRKTKNHSEQKDKINENFSTPNTEEQAALIELKQKIQSEFVCEKLKEIGPESLPTITLQGESHNDPYCYAHGLEQSYKSNQGANLLCLEGKAFGQLNGVCKHDGDNFYEAKQNHFGVEDQSSEKIDDILIWLYRIGVLGNVRISPHKDDKTIQVNFLNFMNSFESLRIPALKIAECHEVSNAESCALKLMPKVNFTKLQEELRAKGMQEYIPGFRSILKKEDETSFIKRYFILSFIRRNYTMAASVAKIYCEKSLPNNLPLVFIVGEMHLEEIKKFLIQLLPGLKVEVNNLSRESDQKTPQERYDTIEKIFNHK